MIYAVYSGDPAEGEDVMRPLREFDDPAMDTSTRMPFLALHGIADELFPVGGRYSWHSPYAVWRTARLVGGSGSPPVTDRFPAMSGGLSCSRPRRPDRSAVRHLASVAAHIR